MLIILHILTFPIARICEAWMDAIDFRYGALPMPKLWHDLKYPRVLSFVAHGVFGLGVYQVYGFWIVLITEISSGFVGYLVFEFALKRFRNYYGSRTLHDLKKQHKEIQP